MSKLPDLGCRTSGILMHMTSLPSKYGIGGLGKESELFIDRLAQAKQSWWQILPIHPVGEGSSPYSSPSAFAGETGLIDPDWLVKQKLLSRKDLATPRWTSASQRIKRAYSWRRDLVSRAAKAAIEKRRHKKKGFDSFRRQNRFWLRDFAEFTVLQAQYKNKWWFQWNAEHRDRQPGAMKRFRKEYMKEILAVEIEQYLFALAWHGIKSLANKKGIGIIGDIPIFVAPGACDVWAHRSIFQLNPQGRPTVVSGCPPDAFNANGQLWGHALYNWSRLKSQKFNWWIERLRCGTKMYDAIRLDHFIGFYRYWEIPAKAKTARSGKWKKVPGRELFTAALKKLGPLPLFAEDLGKVIPPIRALRDEFGFPGMKVLQFAFGLDEEAQHHKPHNIKPASVAYTGTHDNDTSAGWYRTLKAREKDLLHSYYVDLNGRHVASKMVGTLMQSPANTAIIQIQDLFELNSKHRMNTPGTMRGNWSWQIEKDLLKPGPKWNELKRLTEATDRCPK